MKTYNYIIIFSNAVAIICAATIMFNASIPFGGWVFAALCAGTTFFSGLGAYAMGRIHQIKNRKWWQLP